MSYEEPVTDIIRFKQEDVITTSGEQLETGDPTPDPNPEEWE